MSMELLISRRDVLIVRLKEILVSSYGWKECFVPGDTGYMNKTFNGELLDKAEAVDPDKDVFLNYVKPDGLLVFNNEDNSFSMVFDLNLREPYVYLQHPLFGVNREFALNEDTELKDDTLISLRNDIFIVLNEYIVACAKLIEEEKDQEKRLVEEEQQILDAIEKKGTDSEPETSQEPKALDPPEDGTTDPVKRIMYKAGFNCYTIAAETDTHIFFTPGMEPYASDPAYQVIYDIANDRCTPEMKNMLDIACPNKEVQPTSEEEDDDQYELDIPNDELDLSVDKGEVELANRLRELTWGTPKITDVRSLFEKIVQPGTSEEDIIKICSEEQAQKYQEKIYRNFKYVPPQETEDLKEILIKNEGEILEYVSEICEAMANRQQDITSINYTPPEPKDNLVNNENLEEILQKDAEKFIEAHGKQTLEEINATLTTDLDEIPAIYEVAESKGYFAKVEADNLIYFAPKNKQVRDDIYYTVIYNKDNGTCVPGFKDLSQTIMPSVDSCKRRSLKNIIMEYSEGAVEKEDILRFQDDKLHYTLIVHPLVKSE